MRLNIKLKIKLAALERIELEGTDITDMELDETLEYILKKRPQITSLHLGHNAISNVGAEILRKKLSEQTQLTYLDLQHNKIDREGAKAIYSLMSTHLNLNIFFVGNRLTDAGELKNIENAAVRARPTKKKKWWPWGR